VGVVVGCAGWGSLAGSLAWGQPQLGFGMSASPEKVEFFVKNLFKDV